MELTVRPDDLAGGAAALRAAAASLEQARVELSATAARLAPQLGPHAADVAGATLSVAMAGVELVEDDLASYGRGLMAAASYYAALDRHALGRVTVRR